MDAAARIREETRTRCVWLLTKSALLPMPQPGDHVNEHDTAIFWCHKTGAAFGPDGHVACPGDCDRSTRSCYEGPVRL
jgi:hypothetical protein